MIYGVDIDGVLCHNIEDDYAHSIPCATAIAKVNALFDAGHTIKLFTGRGSFDGTNWRPFLEKQLREWGVKYHELITNKPHADIFIDDKAVNVRDWLPGAEVTVEVSRGWGKEFWIVNCAEYCSKLLFLPKGAYSENHYHKQKKETFYCLQGIVALVSGDQESVMDQFSKPLTIQPLAIHSFRGLSNAILLEISTHHKEEDVVFLSGAFKP